MCAGFWARRLDVWPHLQSGPCALCRDAGWERDSRGGVGEELSAMKVTSSVASCAGTPDVLNGGYLSKVTGGRTLPRQVKNCSIVAQIGLGNAGWRLRHWRNGRWHGSSAGQTLGERCMWRTELACYIGCGHWCEEMA